MLVKTKPKMIQRKPQQYHGHTTIELHNVHSGSRERIESDNTFTLGIKNYIHSGGGLNQSPLLTTTLYQRLLGGIFLFNKAIDPVNGVYPTIMPGGTKMIANGYYGASNNSEVTELGSFNANESSFNRNALSFVYDWSTDQANSGEDIESVCLTSNIGGQIGYGNSTSNKRLSSTQILTAGETGQTLMSNTSYNHTMSRSHMYYNASIDESEWTFTFSKKSNVIYNFDMMNFDFDETVTKNLPSVLQQTGRTLLGAVGGKFLCVPVNLVENTSYKLGIYDIEADTWEYVDFTSPVTMTVNQWESTTSYGYDGFCLLNSNIYSNDTRMLLIDYSTGETDVLEENIFRTMRLPMALSNDLILLTKGTSGSVSDQYLTLYDRTTKNEYPINSRLFAGDHACIYPWDDDRLIWVYNSYNFNVQPRHNPLYLATVNNLDEPVTKTASQTMKVTYTVTPA